MPLFHHFADLPQGPQSTCIVYDCTDYEGTHEVLPSPRLAVINRAPPSTSCFRYPFPQTPSYPALPFLGKARSPAVYFGVILCVMATCRTSLSGDVVPSRASTRVDNGRREENHDAIEGSGTGESWLDRPYPTLDVDHDVTTGIEICRKMNPPPAIYNTV